LVKRIGGAVGVINRTDVALGAQGAYGEYTCTATEGVGDAVFLSTADTVLQSDASDTTRMPVIGIIVEKPTTTSCWVIHAGIVTGLSGLTVGSRY